MIINDTYIDELTSLGYSLLSEHNFTPFILNPMSEDNLKQILSYWLEKLSLNSRSISNFLGPLFATFGMITNNIREMNYLSTILYQFYCDTGYNAEYKKILIYMKNNFFLHIVDKNDILHDVQKFNEEKAIKEVH